MSWFGFWWRQNNYGAFSGVKRQCFYYIITTDTFHYMLPKPTEYIILRISPNVIIAMAWLGHIHEDIFVCLSVFIIGVKATLLEAEFAV